MTNEIIYTNKYGSVVFELVTEYIPVKTINHNIVPMGVIFDTDMSEKIALITENRKIQLCMFKSCVGWVWYVIIHETPSTGAIAKVKDINFISDVNPQNELEYLNKTQKVYGSNW